MKRIIMGIAILYISSSMYGVVSADESSAAQSSQATVAQDSASSTCTSEVNGKTKLSAAERKKCESEALKCSASEGGAWFAVGIMIIFYMGAVAVIRVLINSPTWILSEALSEEKVQAPATAGGTPAQALTPSASRLIAFIGSIVLIGLFFTSSFYVVWALFTCQPLSRLDDLGTYLLSGAALFAPYAVNKLSEIFKIKP